MLSPSGFHRGSKSPLDDPALEEERRSPPPFPGQAAELCEAWAGRVSQASFSTTLACCGRGGRPAP